jgi:rhodanese-related sulfurtransferase
MVLLATVALLPACGGVPKGRALGEPERVDIGTVEAWLESGEAVVVLDSRSDVAWDRGSTKALGAIRVPPSDVAGATDRIPEEGRIVVYCT